MSEHLKDDFSMKYHEEIAYMHSAQRGNVVSGFYGVGGRAGRIIIHLLWVMTLISVLGNAVESLASADLQLFGPKRYERTQGKPWVFTDTFNGCANSAGQALVRVQNGSSKDSSLSSALINLNGSNVFVESDFKNQTMWLERTVTIRPGSNTLSTQLKSGGQKETPFLVIEILGIGCDSTPPVISNPKPTDGALLNTARPTISASYGDNSGGSGINTASVRVTLDGSDITSSCTVGATAISCTPAANLAEGAHNVTLAVSDLLQNPAALGWRFTTDTVAPRAAIITPTNNQYLGRFAVTVSGSIDDPTATVSVNRKAATINGALFSVADVPLAEGDNTLTVIARDPAGNQTQSGVMVRVDTSLPQVTITTPVDGSFTNIPTVTVNGTISESPESVQVNGRSATITGQVFTLPQFPLAEGLNSLTVVAADYAGNEGTAIVTVNLDTVNPQIFISTPADGILTRNPQLTITGSVSEPVTSLTINGSVVAVSPALTFSSTLTLNEGSNAILLKATDRAGNKGNASITVTLDSTAPNAPTLEGLTTPTNRAIVTVNGSAEQWSSVSLYNGVERVATIVTPQDGRFSFAGITLNNGDNHFSVTALDAAGNESVPSAPVSVTLDTAAPVVSIATPLDKAILNTPVITVSESINDPTAIVTVNGLPALSSGGIWTLEGFTLQEGSNTLLVEARDPAGNKGSATVSVTLDTIAPEVYVTAPLDGLYTNMATLSVRGQASETMAAVTINGRAATINDTAFTLSDLQLTEGSNTITVEATDLAGNKGTETVSVTLDTIAPQLTVIGPDDGALLNNGQITFGGAAAEPVVSVVVNTSTPLSAGSSTTVQAGTNGGYTLPVTLAEGSNTLTVTATDRAGNRTTSTINVNLDSTPPAAPLLNAQATPTRTGTTVVSGQAEANAQVKLFNNGQPVASLKADENGLFAVPNVTLAEGNNPFTAQAVDAAGNASPLSAPLTVVLDTKAPVITVTAPQPGAVISAAQVTIKGSVDEALAALTINGASTPLSAGALTFEYTMPLAAGENSALITATDLAGNVATTTFTIQRDSTPPKVVITTPMSGLLTNTPQIQVSGTVDDAEATLTLSGAAVTVVNKAFSASYVLTDGDNSIQVKAVDKAGNEGAATVTVTLDAQRPVVTLNAPATATAGANVSITINATDNRTLTLAELRANGVPIWSASPTSSASATETIGYRLSPDLSAGAEVALQLRAMDAAGNEGVTTAKILISQAAAGPGFVQGKVLDDTRGLRMAGATVTVTDSKGGTKTATSGSDGDYFFEIPSGEALVKITRPGYTSVERRLAVRPEQKVTVLDARLTKVNDTKGLIDATGGVVKSTPFKIQNSSFTIDLTIPVNALAAEGDLRITPVSNQGLIGTLPLGWSPLAVADMRLLNPATGSALDSVTFASVATAKFTMPAIANLATATLTLARYGETAHQWLAAGSATPTTDGLSATADILTSGQYAIVISDPAPNAPQSAQSGQPLAAAALQSLDFSLTTATGKVIPQAAPPSAGLKAAGEVVVTVKADAAQQPVFTSGLLLGGRITEKFDLLSGDKVEPVSYTQDIVLYRHPCVTNIGAGAVSLLAVNGAELRTTFSVSPSKDYTIVDLLLGKVGIEILPPDTTETGVMVGTVGGRILDADGNILVIPQGALSQTTPVSTKSVAASAVIGDDFTLLKTVEVNFTRQTLATSATLSIPAPTGLDANLPLVIAKGVTVKGVNKLKLVTRAKQSGSFITSVLLAPELTNSSNSINSSGTYYFLQAKGQIGFVIGAITDASNNPFAGALVKTDSGSLVDLSENSGKYLLAAPVAAFNATATDLYKGDEVTAAGAITAANQVVTLNLSIKMIPPRVTTITPANGAANVQPSVSVVVSFSKPMDKATITSNTIVVRDAANNPVPGVLTFNVDNTVVTFYPSDAFKQETKYTVTIAASVKDVQSYPLGQDVVSNFTVRKTTPPVMPAAGAVSGTFPDANGFISVTATQGTAPADCTVLLINDTSGEIQSVTPASNGSFTGKVRGQLGDEIKVVLMDYSGNQTLVSYITFKNDDGKYLVTAKGGKVEGEGGSLLDIPEGALVGPVEIKVTALQETNLPNPVQTPGKYLAGFNIDTGGINFQKEVHLSIPVPDGFDTKTPVFVTKPGEVYNEDGTIEKVYEIIDSTKIVNGRITTASPPFDGITGIGSYVFAAFPEVQIGIVSGYTYQEMNAMSGYQPAPSGVVETPVKDATGNLIYKYDRPVPRAVIRTPASWNYVSYANAHGFYAGFTTLFANVGSTDVEYKLTATHPLTMRRETVTGYLSAEGMLSRNIENINFKLADKDTILPDKTPPVISFSVEVASGSTGRMTAGTIAAGTMLDVPVEVIDQGMGSTTLSVTFEPPNSTSKQYYTYTLAQNGKPAPSSTLELTKTPVYSYKYTPQFASAPLPNHFETALPGIYTFLVEATDAAGNKSSKSVRIRALDQGADLGTSIDGPPTVDYLLPAADAKDVPIATNIIATFSEPVENVNETTFTVFDTVTGKIVPASVFTQIVDGRIQAVLVPQNSLSYGRDYRIKITRQILDVSPNLSADNKKLPLKEEVVATFTTMSPHAYDLADGQFQNGRDVDIYVDATTGRRYAYVTAGDTGFKIIEVTDPTNPVVVNTLNHSSAGVSWNYRYVAVHPDQPMLAVTENIQYSDGNQYGYLRLYDLTTPANPTVIGREILAEAYSGMPGRVALTGDYALIATAGAGLQVVNTATAKKNQTEGIASDGSAVVTAFDSIYLGFGSPNDLKIMDNKTALLTTNDGYLLPLDISPLGTVDDSTLMINYLTAYRPSGSKILRVAAAPQFSYTDELDGSSQTIDLAVVWTREGQIITLDMTDPANPTQLRPGKAVDEAGATVNTIAMDIAINKNDNLAYVTTNSAIQVFDLKDPNNPKLIKTMTQLDNNNGSLVTLGSAPSILQKDGLVYMASQAQGFKVVDLVSPIYLELVAKEQIPITTAYFNPVSFLLNHVVTADPATGELISDADFSIRIDSNGKPYMPGVGLFLIAKDSRGNIRDLSNNLVKWNISVEYKLKYKSYNWKTKTYDPREYYNLYKIPESGSIETRGNVYPVNWNSNFGGGKITIRAETSIDGLPFVRKKEAYIQGQTNQDNPALKNKIIDYLEKPIGVSGYADLYDKVGYNKPIRAIAYHESVHTYTHFEKLNQTIYSKWAEELGYSAELAYPIVNKKNTRDPVTKLINSRFSDGGFGLMQLTDPAPSYLQIWNYRENINAGVALFKTKLWDATSRLNAQHPLPLGDEGKRMLRMETYYGYGPHKGRNSKNYYVWSDEEEIWQYDASKTYPNEISKIELILGP